MKSIHSLCLAATVLSLGAYADEPAGFAAHRSVTFSGYSGASALEDFPVLVKLPVNEFKRADHQDLVITDADGTPLAYEIDSVTASEVNLWVKIPSLTKDTVITAWFGRDEAEEKSFTAADVWTKYAAVWHLNTDATDATGHGLTQTSYRSALVSEVSATDSLVGRSLKLDANNEAGLWFSTPKETFIDKELGDGEHLTVTGWLKPQAAIPSKAMRLFCWKGNTEYQGFDTFQNTNGKFYIRGKNKNVSWITASAIPWTAGQWSHLAAVFDKQGETQVYSAYLNGTEMPVDSNATNARTSDLLVTQDTNKNTTNLGFGNVGSLSDNVKHNDYQYPFANGQLDELRLYRGVASADWIKAEHDTVSAASFAVYGSIQYSGVSVDGTWTGAGATGRWSDPANWADGKVAVGQNPTVTFASEAAGAQTIDLEGAAVRVQKLIQNDDVTRTITGGSLAFSESGDITVADGTLVFAQDFSATGLVKTGAGELRFDAGFALAGDLTIEAGTVTVNGAASQFVSGAGKDWTLTPEKTLAVTHLGLNLPESGVIDRAARVSVKKDNSGSVPLMQVRFSVKTPGVALEEGYTYLRLPYPMTLAAGTEYFVNATDVAFSGRLIAADASVAQTVNGTVSIAAEAALKLGTATLEAHGLTGAGRIIATSPAQIDLSMGADQTFAGATEGPLGLIKRSAFTLDLTGEGLFADGITCRDGRVRAATATTVDPKAMLIFGDNTGANKTGSFSVAADNAVLSNPIGVTEMTTSALSAQGLYAEGGKTLTVTGTELSDQDSETRVTDWKPGQIGLHAHANAAGNDPTLVFSGNTVAYIDVAARLDGDATRAAERPGNAIVIDDITAPSKVRKLTVQNNTAEALGGTLTFTATRPFVSDWLDLVGYQTKVVMAQGSKVRVDTNLRFNTSTPSWEPVSANDVDWTIGEGAVLAANGFPSTLEYMDPAKAKGSVLRIDGGTLKMNHHVAAEEPREIFMLGARVPVEITEKGATIDLVPEQTGAADDVSISAPMSGEGGLTLKGDATKPTVVLAESATLGYTGATTLDQVTLAQPSGARALTALVANDSIVSVGEDASLMVGQLTGTGLVKSGAGALAVKLDGNTTAASEGTVSVSEGTLGLVVGTKTVEPTLVTNGDFEPITEGGLFHKDTSGDGSRDKRCKRDAEYLTTNLPAWSFGPSDTDGSGLCCNASYFSNSQQINENKVGGAENYYAVFLRKTATVGPGVISREVITEKDNTTLIVSFQFNVRAYSNNTFYGKIGVLFDGEPVYETRTRKYIDSSDPFKTWDVCTVEIEVPKAGTHTLAFTAADVVIDGAKKDCEALLDNVMIGTRTIAADGMQERLGGLVFDIAAGAKLDLGDGVNVKLSKVLYGGNRVTGVISSATHPEFVTGTGKVKVNAGLAVFVR